jgi:transcriptional regulator
MLPSPLTDDHLLVNIIDMSKIDMSKQHPNVPYGTLDLLVLKTLETMGEMNGYRIARRIEQVSGDALKLSQGAIYPALIRLEQEGWIRAQWGISETNRKVKFYSLTKPGAKQLEAEVRKWEQANALLARFLEAAP